MANDIGTRYQPHVAQTPDPATELNNPSTKANKRYGIVTALMWAFVLSRLFFMEVASLAYMYLPHAWIESPQGTLPPPGSTLYRILIGFWVHWDGLWYLSIANMGYGGRPTSTAFFPLYPLAMHVLGGGVLAGVLVSLLSFAVALWFIYHLFRIDLGDRPAWYAVLALSFFPTSLFNNAVYSESLFLALASAALYFGRTRRYWLAAPLAGLSTLVTMYGLFLAAPLAWLIWRQEGWRWKKFAYLLWIPAGLASYMAYLVPLFGDPLVFEHAQSNWARHFMMPYQTLWQALLTAWQYLIPATNFSKLFAPGFPTPNLGNLWNFVFAIVALVVFFATIRKVPFYLTLYTGLALLLPLSYPSSGDPLMSFPRLILEAFPLFAGLGVLIARRPALRYLYFATALPIGVLFTALFATAHWVA